MAYTAGLLACLGENLFFLTEENLGVLTEETEEKSFVPRC
jgi:hypothetical protein